MKLLDAYLICPFLEKPLGESCTYDTKEMGNKCGKEWKGWVNSNLYNHWMENVYWLSKTRYNN